jgi:hypothetical protein
MEDVQRLFGSSLESLETDTTFRRLGRLSYQHPSRHVAVESAGLTALAFS